MALASVTRSLPYWMGPCVGRGSVVGLGVGTGGEVDGEGAGVTVWTDGPVLVVSPARSVLVRGYIIAITAKATAAASASGTQLLKAEERRGPSGSLGSRRGSRGFSYVMGLLRSFPGEQPADRQSSELIREPHLAKRSSRSAGAEASGSDCFFSRAYSRTSPPTMAPRRRRMLLR